MRYVNLVISHDVSRNNIEYSCPWKKLGLTFQTIFTSELIDSKTQKKPVWTLFAFTLEYIIFMST